MKNRFINNINQ